MPLGNGESARDFAGMASALETNMPDTHSADRYRFAQQSSARVESASATLIVLRSNARGLDDGSIDARAAWTKLLKVTSNPVEA